MQGRKTCCSGRKQKRSKSTLPKIDKSRESPQLTPEEKRLQAEYFDFIEKKDIIC